MQLGVLQIKKKKKGVSQIHHVFYTPEEIVTRIYQGEHYLITMLNRRTKNISAGFIHSLLFWIENNILNAIDLNLPEESCKVYKNDLFNFIRKNKEIKMNDTKDNLIGKVSFLDCWQNVYTKYYTLKIKFENKIYLISIPVDRLASESINEVLSYIDVFFPNLDDVFKIEEIMDFNDGKK